MVRSFLPAHPKLSRIGSKDPIGDARTLLVEARWGEYAQLDEDVEPPGPWDDCFTELAHEPVLRWGDFSLRLSSSADHWVVYDGPEHAICVEPQTGAPDAHNSAPDVLDTGEHQLTTFTLVWG